MLPHNYRVTKRDWFEQPLPPSPFRLSAQTEQFNYYEIVQRVNPHRVIQAAGALFGPAQEQTDQEQIGKAQNGQVRGGKRERGHDQQFPRGDRRLQQMMQSPAIGDFLEYGVKPAKC